MIPCGTAAQKRSIQIRLGRKNKQTPKHIDNEGAYREEEGPFDLNNSTYVGGS